MAGLTVLCGTWYNLRGTWYTCVVHGAVCVVHGTLDKRRAKPGRPVGTGHGQHVYFLAARGI